MEDNERREALLAAMGDSNALSRMMGPYIEREKLRENAGVVATLRLIVGVSHPVTDAILAAALGNDLPESIRQRLPEAIPEAVARLTSACRHGDADAGALLLQLLVSGICDRNAVAQDASLLQTLVRIAREKAHVAAKTLKALHPQLSDHARLTLFRAIITTKSATSDALTALATEIWASIPPDARMTAIRNLEHPWQAGRLLFRIHNVATMEERLALLMVAEPASWTPAFETILACAGEPERLAIMALALQHPNLAAQAFTSAFATLRPAERDALAACAVSNETAARTLAAGITGEQWRAISDAARSVLTFACQRWPRMASVLLKNVSAAMSPNEVQSIIDAVMRHPKHKASAAADLIVEGGEAALSRIDADLRHTLIHAMGRSPTVAARACAAVWPQLTAEERAMLLSAIANVRDDEGARHVMRFMNRFLDDVRAMSPRQREPLIRAASVACESAAHVASLLWTDLEDDERRTLLSAITAIQTTPEIEFVKCLIDRVRDDVHRLTSDQRAAIVRIAALHAFVAAHCADALWEALTPKELDQLMTCIASSPGAIERLLTTRGDAVRAMSPAQRRPLVQAFATTINAHVDAVRLMWSVMTDEEKQGWVESFIQSPPVSGKSTPVLWDSMSAAQRRRFFHEASNAKDGLQRITLLYHLNPNQIARLSPDEIDVIVTQSRASLLHIAQTMRCLGDALRDEHIAFLAETKRAREKGVILTVAGDRLARMRQEHRHAILRSFVPLGDQDALKAAERIHQFLDDADRSVLIKRFGFTSMDIALVLQRDAPWCDWMSAFLPDLDATSDEESHPLIEAWTAVVARVPYPYVMHAPPPNAAARHRRR